MLFKMMFGKSEDSEDEWSSDDSDDKTTMFNKNLIAGREAYLKERARAMGASGESGGKLKEYTAAELDAILDSTDLLSPEQKKKMKNAKRKADKRRKFREKKGGGMRIQQARERGKDLKRKRLTRHVQP